MNDENSLADFYSNSENLNPNPDFKNLLKISNRDLIKKDNTDEFNYKKKKLSQPECSTDEKSYSNESRKTSGSYLTNQNLKTVNFINESNSLTGSNFELNNKSNAEKFKFNLSQMRIENGDNLNTNETQAKHNNADITFENNNKNNYNINENNNNKLENFESFANNDIKENKLEITFSNEKYKIDDFSILNTNLVIPNNHILNSICESHEKIKKDDNINLENKESNRRLKFVNFENNQSPKKIEKLQQNDSLYQRLFSSCNQNKVQNANEISESERKFNLDLIDNFNFSINENLLEEDSILISKFNEMETPLGNQWQKILNEINETYKFENSEADISSTANDNENSNCNINNINNSHVLGNFDPINHSLNSFYDVHLNQDEYEKFLALDSKAKQAWLLKHKKDIYDLITNKTNNLNIQSLLNVKEKKGKNNSNNNLTRLRRRKSLLEIHYCHIEFEQNETYEGEKLDVNSTSINGYGIYKYKNGDVYEGDFFEGKRHGLGEYIYKDKSYYRGEWDNDCKSGRGVYCKNGKEFNGIWSENNFISGFVFELKNLKVDEVKQEGSSLSASNCENNFNSAYSIEEEYLDAQQIKDFFEDYALERLNSNFTYAEFLKKYKAIQKEYLSHILMTNYDFLSGLKVETEIHLNDIIFNQKSIFKKFFNNTLAENKQKDSTNESQSEMSFSFTNQEPIEKLNIEDLIFFSDCPLEETTHNFSEIYKLDFSLKCDCKKIRNFISHFC